MATDHDDTHLNLTDASWAPTLRGGGDAAAPLHPCVVLAGLDTPIPEPMHTALNEAGLVPRIEHDPRLAMAEVCLLRREARHRAASGEQPDSYAPLILLTSPTGAIQDMIDTLAQVLPDIPLLLLSGKSLNTLHAVEPPKSDVDADEVMSLLGRALPSEQEPA